MADITFPKAGKASEVATKSVGDLKAEVQNRIDQIHTTEKEQSAYLSSDDIAELEKMETLLQGSLALLEQFEKTGGMMPATTDIAKEDGVQLSSAAMKVGWNGGYQSETTNPKYDEVIMPYNQGTDVKNGLIFKMDDSMESVKGKNVGTDIAVTVTYKDGSEKKYLLKGMVTNPTPLIIAADQTTVGVTVDFSQVKRVSGNDPKKVDLTILGGSGDDILIGSQGNDQIYGNDGADVIYGMGGINTIDGGAGTDELHSVNKFDAISGGGGYDKVIATEKDAANAATFTEETEFTKTTPVDKDENFTGSGWVAEPNEDKGELIITKTADAKDGGTITLTVPDGVMVYSKEDGTDLVLTYQPIGDDGIPGNPQVVRIKDVLNSKSNAKITITSKSQDNPSIIDLGSVNTQYNQITLTKGQGDDVIIAPKTAFDLYDISAADIGTTSIAPAAAKKINDEMEKNSDTHWIAYDNGDSTKKFSGWAAGKKPKVESNGDITMWAPEGQKTMDLQAPDVEGYTFLSSVAQESADKSETTLTLFMQKDGSDQIERLVIHVKKTGGNPETLTVGGDVPQDASIITKLVANVGDSGGGIFVADESTSDKSKAGDNEVVDK